MSRKKWNAIQSRIVLGTAAIGLGIMILLFRLLVPQNKDILEDTPRMTLAEAAAHQGPVAGPVLLQGKLVTKRPVVMPDGDEQVIAGKILLSAKDLDSLAEERRETVLFEWQQVASEVQFTDGETVLSLEIVEDLPLIDDRRTRVDIEYEGKSARTSVPVTATLGKLTYSLKDLDYKSPLTRLERARIPNNQAAVLIAGIAEGGKITAPPKGRLGFHPGSLAEAQTRAGNLGLAMILLGIILVAAGAFFRRMGLIQQRRARLY